VIPQDDRVRLVAVEYPAFLLDHVAHAVHAVGADRGEDVHFLVKRFVRPDELKELFLFHPVFSTAAFC
jgi:hypothetical protein